MAEFTGISWTHHTFNVIWGCTKISPACSRCYAEVLAHRFGVGWGPDAERKTFGEKHWNDPSRWERAAKKAGVRRLVFSSSMADNFEDHPTVIEEMKKLWPVIRATPNLVWQLLTKRPERILGQLPDDWGVGYPNVWIGATIENNDYIDRADHLRAVPAKVRFVSYEPMCGPIDQLDLTDLHWVIAGGESGQGFREHDPQWARDSLAACKRAGVAFFYKQGSGLKSGQDPYIDGVEYKEFPDGFVYEPLPKKKSLELPLV